MRGMHSESVELIYLDPPCNSNRTYSAPIGSEAAGAAFKDLWTLDDVDIAWIGLIAEKEPCLPSVLDAAGIAHGKAMKSYLVMMAVRLLEMRRLLKPTGALYLHCDPTASHYLKLGMDCVFGAANFRSEVHWYYYNKMHDSRKKLFAASTDTIFFYVKDGDSDFQFHQLKEQREKPVRQLVRVKRDGKMVNARDETGKLLYQVKTERTIDNVWRIPCLQPASRERLGYPTQKPLALLDRIIEASSNEGDVVLDPFCACATTCVSAHALGRLWTAIDISPKAAELIVQRLRQDYKRQRVTWMTQATKVIHRTDIPKRTDVGKLPPYKTHKHTLYGKQEGRCAGCKHHFPFQNFTVDHIVPKSKGGMDHLENLQLLCNHCNSVQGTMDQAAFTAKLKNMGLSA